MALIFSILGVLGIIGIPVGFVNEFMFIAIPSIAIVVFDFYGLVFFWLSYGNAKKMERVYKACEEEHIYSVEEINKYTQINEKEIILSIQKLITKGILKGYLFDGKELTLNQKGKLEKKKFIEVCPFCGGKKISFVEGEDKFTCDYCGATFSK